MKTMPLRISLNSRSQMLSMLPSSKVMLVNRVLGTAVLTHYFPPCSSPFLFSQTAMDNASKNAKDMIGSLQMKYNRGRQAAITNELVDIITGKFLILLQPCLPHLRIPPSNRY